MSDITSELNLNLAVDDDDTADYLTIALRDSLTTIDGLFSSSTGHSHNGAHQGGNLEFLDLTVGEDLTVVGQSLLQGPVVAQGTLHVVGNETVDGSATLASLHVTGATTLDGPINSGNLTLSGNLTVGTDLSVGRNASVVGQLSVGSLVGAAGGLSISGNATISGVLSAPRVVIGGYDVGWTFNVAGGAPGTSTNPITSGYWHQRGRGDCRAWDNLDFTFDTAGSANTLVKRDSAGGIQIGGGGNVYWPSGAVGGKPAYIIGQSGDGQFHWWPASAVGPPAVVVHLAAQVGYGTQGNDGWANSWQVSLTADRSGQWLVVGRASRSTYNSGVQLSVGSTAPGGSLGAFHGLDQGSANTSNGLAGDWWVGFLSSGQVVSAKAYMATMFSGGTLYLDMYFIPTAAYNGV